MGFLGIVHPGAQGLRASYPQPPIEGIVQVSLMAGAANVEDQPPGVSERESRPPRVPGRYLATIVPRGGPIVGARASRAREGAAIDRA